ncbi:MAG: kinase [Hyphomonadaceae bacterium]
MNAIADLLTRLIAAARASNPNRPALIGVGGAQGSGKSYQCRAYAAAHPRVAHFSLDDVYLTRAEREARADIYANEAPVRRNGRFEIEKCDRPELRSLFLTRGPPGTHDLRLAGGLIARLGSALPTFIPRFDKSRDDRANDEAWAAFAGPADAILMDGWCMGALPPVMSPPINDVEASDAEDTKGGWIWQNRIIYELTSTYAHFFAAFDALIYLQAPSWEIVRVWRGQQEAETLGRPLTREENAALDRFVMHYERVTRAMLAGHHCAQWVVHLDEERDVVRVDAK